MNILGHVLRPLQRYADIGRVVHIFYWEVSRKLKKVQNCKNAIYFEVPTYIFPSQTEKNARFSILF